MHTEARAAIETSGFSRDSESYESRWQTDARSKSQHSTIFENCLQSHHLSADEKKMQRLAQEAFTIIVAGGETTARVLATATFHIMANKERVVPRLLDELRLVMADPSDIMSLKSAEQLPWLVSRKSPNKNLQSADVNPDCYNQRVSSNHCLGNLPPPTGCPSRLSPIQRLGHPRRNTNQHDATRRSPGRKSVLKST